MVNLVEKNGFSQREKTRVCANQTSDQHVLKMKMKRKQKNRQHNRVTNIKQQQQKNWGKNIFFDDFGPWKR